MALETISQILSSTNATYINGVSAERRISPAILANMYQGLVEKDGKGINDKFVTENDAQSSAQVFVNRVLPVKMKPREMGANKNGASFSENQHFVQTITVQIELLQVLDDPIIIPRARQDMIKVDLLAEQTKIYSDRLRTIINGATFACKLLTTWIEDSKGNPVNAAIFALPAQAGDPTILNQFIEANSLLDEGDSANGVDIFPEDTRVAVFKPSYRATLKTSGVLILGGANYAYDIAKGGAISTESKVTKTEDGFIGEIDGVPCHIISGESLQHASEFLGFAEDEVKKSPVVGYISSSYANARGVSTSKLTKVVDTRGGQGLELQPYCKFGVATWYPKGNVILTKAEFNPVKSLKTLFASYLDNIAFKLKGAGSRLYPDLELSDASATGCGVEAEVYDSFGTTSHVVAYAWYVGTAAATDLADFFAKYAAASYNGVGAATSGAVDVTLSTTVAANSYINVLAIADDGSVVYKAIKYTA